MRRAGPAWAQPIEVRGFGVTGPVLAGPPSLANPHILFSQGGPRRGSYQAAELGMDNERTPTPPLGGTTGSANEIN